MLWLHIRNWLRHQEGQDLTEYALLGVLIAVACVFAVAAVGTQIAAVWDKAVTALGSW